MGFAFDQSAINKLIRRHLESLDHSIIYYDMPDGQRGGGLNFDRRKVHSIMERIHGLNADVISHCRGTLYISEIDPLTPQQFLETGKFDQYGLHEDAMMSRLNEVFELGLTTVSYIYAPVHRRKNLFDLNTLPIGPTCTNQQIEYMYLTDFIGGVPDFTSVRCIES
jgi:hypothetical protein